MTSGIGFGLVIGPIYISEISPARYRGFIGCFPQLFLCIGTIMGDTTQFAFSYVDSNIGWRLMMGVPLILSAISTSFSFRRRFPESPCYVAIDGKLDAVKTLLVEKFGAPQEEVEERIQQLKKVANIPDQINGDTLNFDRSQLGGIARMWGQLFRSMETVLFVATLHILRVMSGEDSVLTHLSITLSEHDTFSLATYLVARLMLTTTEMLFSLMMLLLVDRAGRKGLLVTSIFMVMVANGILGVSAILNQHDRISNGARFNFFVGGALLLEVGVGLGLGGLPWLFGAEAFKLPSRAMGVGIAMTIGLMIRWFINTSWVSVYTSKVTSDQLMLLSASLMIIGITICCRAMKNHPKSKRILIDADLGPSSSN